MFDFRYHALSLVAVFLALGIGILLGVTIGDSLLSEADQGLRESLREDVVDARAANEEANDDLDKRERLIDEALPSLAGQRLAGRRIAIVSVGSMPEEMESSVRDAVETAGGEVDSVSVIPAPPETDELTEAAGRRFDQAEKDPLVEGALGRRIGNAIVRGDPLLDELESGLPEQFRGDFAGADAVVFHRSPTDDPAPATEAFEAALLDGVDDAGTLTVGVEAADAEPSQIPFYETRGLTSVDSVDVAGGRAVLVYALAGAKGTFGFKETADEVLPDPSAGAPAGAAVRDRR